MADETYLIHTACREMEDVLKAEIIKLRAEVERWKRALSMENQTAAHWMSKYDEAQAEIDWMQEQYRDSFKPMTVSDSRTHVSDSESE